MFTLLKKKKSTLLNEFNNANNNLTFYIMFKRKCIIHFKVLLFFINAT